MSISNEEKPEIRVSYDNMQAFLKLPVPQSGKEYSVRDILMMLEAKGIKTGIDQEMIMKIIRDKLFLVEHLVASGVEPVEGRDGYYEFLFNQEFNHTPKELPDGSVDYRAINLIATVAKGDTIAEYHPSVQGRNGYNVKGAPLAAKRCKELVPLKGKGFERSKDGNTYVASLDGKVDFLNGRLIISPLYEITSDVNLQTGDISFSGDVKIHGAIRPGMSVYATGTITVDGIVENARLESGKDIVLKSGLMGNSEAIVKTKGDLYAKFVEYAFLDIKGTINAETLLNCDVVCGEKVIISGKQGKIVGGSVNAVAGMVANYIGNEVEIKTDISVGAESDVYRRYKILEHKIATSRHQIELIDEQMKKLDQDSISKIAMERPKKDPRKMSLIRKKIRENTILQENQLEIEELEEIIRKAENADITVTGSIFPGTNVRIDDLRLQIKEQQDCVQIIKYMERIRLERLE